MGHLGDWCNLKPYRMKIHGSVSLCYKLFHFGRSSRQHVCRRISTLFNILPLTSDSWTFSQSTTIPITQGLCRKPTLSNSLPFNSGLWTPIQFSTIPKAQRLSQNLNNVQHSAIDFTFLDFQSIHYHTDNTTFLQTLNTIKLSVTECRLCALQSTP